MGWLGHGLLTVTHFLCISSSQAFLLCSRMSWGSSMRQQWLNQNVKQHNTPCHALQQVSREETAQYYVNWFLVVGVQMALIEDNLRIWVDCSFRGNFLKKYYFTLLTGGLWLTGLKRPHVTVEWLRNPINTISGMFLLACFACLLAMVFCVEEFALSGNNYNNLSPFWGIFITSKAKQVSKKNQ